MQCARSDFPSSKSQPQVKKTQINQPQGHGFVTHSSGLHSTLKQSRTKTSHDHGFMTHRSGLPLEKISTVKNYNKWWTLICATIIFPGKDFLEQPKAVGLKNLQKHMAMGTFEEWGKPSLTKPMAMGWKIFKTNGRGLLWSPRKVTQNVTHGHGFENFKFPWPWTH